jgi:ATP-dependent Clp protease ATP-binding subunit ClpB
MRRNPLCVILFDEIEKAHPDVFNIFLQILDDARLTDNRGLTVSFSEAIIIMTTNIGTPHFLDASLDFATARQQALAELTEKYRPEFLNRFNGRQNIVCFHRLELPIIARIAARELHKLNERIKSAGLQVVMSEDHLHAMCQDHYAPGEGARGITGYFATHIHPAVANTILMTPESQGIIQVQYNAEKQGVEIAPPQPVAAPNALLTQETFAPAGQPS